MTTNDPPDPCTDSEIARSEQDARSEPDARFQQTGADVLDQFLASARVSERFRTQAVLGCFGRERRGPVVNDQIEGWLAENRLEMFPRIADADYYGEVEVRRLGETGETPAKTTESTSGDETPFVPRTGLGSWVLSSLKDDAEELDFLLYTSTVEDALTKMKDRGRSKVPLFFSKDDFSSLVGTVTMSNLTYDKVNKDSHLPSQAIVQVPVVRTDEKLFDWIPSILSYGFIYGKNHDGEIVQIYTTHDVASHLNTIAAMFLRANEVEELIRTILMRVTDDDLDAARRRHSQLTNVPLDNQGTTFFSRQDIAASESQALEQRAVETMTFADYMKCIGDPTIWSQHFESTGLPALHKEACLRSLNDARRARNTVMHFNRSDSLDSLIPSFEASAVWLRQVAAAADE